MGRNCSDTFKIETLLIGPKKWIIIYVIVGEWGVNKFGQISRNESCSTQSEMDVISTIKTGFFSESLQVIDKSNKHHRDLPGETCTTKFSFPVANHLFLNIPCQSTFFAYTAVRTSSSTFERAACPQSKCSTTNLWCRMIKQIR